MALLCTEADPGAQDSGLLDTSSSVGHWASQGAAVSPAGGDALWNLPLAAGGYSVILGRGWRGN